MFIFANRSSNRMLIETDVGTCQFCDEDGVDLYETRSELRLFGFFRTGEDVNKMIYCESCKQACKASYFTGWSPVKKDGNSKHLDADGPSSNHPIVQGTIA